MPDRWVPGHRQQNDLFSEELPMPPGAAPLSMKIIPLRWRGAGLGCSQPEDPPRRLMPSAPPWTGIFMGAFHAPSGGTTKDENLIPPWKAVQGDVLWRTWHWEGEEHAPTPPLD